MKVLFTALGGGQEVGRSCYFVQLNGTNLILDCGGRSDWAATPEPDLDWLLHSGLIRSWAEINYILISHSHMDHIGGLPVLAGRCREAAIFATALTRDLAYEQLWWRSTRFGGTQAEQAEEREQVDWTLSRIQALPYAAPQPLPGFTLTLYEAGHIPGAAMVHLQTPRGSLLYTGDFCDRATPITAGYALPPDLRPEVVLACGLHAHHPEQSVEGGRRYLAAQLRTELEAGRTVCLRANQLTKGVELLAIINGLQDEAAIPLCPVYLGRSVYPVAERLGAAYGRLLRANHRRLEPGAAAPGPGIVIAADEPFPAGPHIALPADFSLHADYRGLANLLLRLNPRIGWVVHTAAAHSDGHKGFLGFELLIDPASRTQLSYPENGDIYTLSEVYA